MEIRVLCDPSDEAAAVAALATVLALDPVRRYRTRDGARVRLHVTAALPDVPVSAEQAYADAPSLHRELDWVADRVAAHVSEGGRVEREFWLRKAAALDRVAVDETGTCATETTTTSARTAEKAAALLVRHDRAHGTTRGPLGPPPSDLSHRPYVRQEYRAWLAARTDSP